MQRVTDQDLSKIALVVGMLELLRKDFNTSDFEFIHVEGGPSLSLAVINQKIDKFIKNMTE